MSRLVFVTQWFPPEPAHTPHWIARALRAKGIDVEILTGIPNYPSGVVADGYSAAERRTEVIEGFTVQRTPLYPNHGSGASRRMLNYISWAVSAALFGLRRLGRADVALVYSSPATAALPAMAARRLFGTRYVLMVQDVWPDSVFASGFLTGRLSRFAERLLGWFVDATYRWAEHIVVIAPGMADLLHERGVPRSKLSVVYNWVEEPSSIGHHVATRASLGLTDEDFVLMYAGNHGAAQALDAVVEGIGRLPEEVRGHLVMVGDGMEKARLQAVADKVASGRVKFLGPQPRDAIAGLMAIADAQVVSLAAQPLFEVTVPSKLQSVMAAGFPVLAAASGDVRRIVEAADCGEVAVPGDPASVAAAMERLHEAGPATRERMGRDGKEHYETNMSEMVSAGRLADVLQSAAKARRKR